MIEIIIATMATFGLSALISNYDGPFDVLSSLRSRLKVLECTVCVSTWIAIPIAIYTGVGIIGCLSIIGGVILLERLT